MNVFINKLNFILINLMLLMILSKLGNSVKKKALKKKINIAYGGILDKYVNVQNNDTALLRVAKFAVTFAQSRNPENVPVNAKKEILPYTISEPRKLKLVFTMDQRRPYMGELSDLNPHMEELFWGYTYNFKVSWTTSHPPESTIHRLSIPNYTHHFVVTDYDEDFYIYQHTFTQDTHLTHNLKSPLVLEKDFTKDMSADKVMLEDSNKNLLSVSLLKDTCDKSENNCDKYVENGHQDIVSNDMKDNCNYQTYASKYGVAMNKNDAKENMVLLKVLSFNVWNTNVVRGGIKAYMERIKHLAKLCRESGADVIGFQEVRFHEGRGGNWGPNQVEHLANLLKPFQPAQVQTDSIPDFVVEGLAFFSRYPISNQHFHLLTLNHSDIADGHQRILFSVEVDVPSVGKVNLYNTHLSLSHLARATSVKEIWKHMKLRADRPAFLMGDFNAESHNEEIQFLQGRYKMDGDSTHGLHDVWHLKFGPNNKGFTFNTLEKHLSKRIDFIFMLEHAQVLLRDVQLIDDKKRGKQAASDHLGLLATFQLNLSKD